MFKRTRVLLATVGSVVATLLAPAAGALADTGSGTPITEAEWKTAMIAASAASKAREVDGYSIQTTMGPIGFEVEYDRATGRQRSDFAGFVEVISAGDVTWIALGDDAQTRGALKLLGRTDATFMRSTEAVPDDPSTRPEAFGPSAMFSAESFKDDDSTYSSITRTTLTDGTTAYRVVATDPDKNAVDAIIKVSAVDGSVLGMTGTLTTEGVKSDVTIAFGYGAQEIKLPAASTTVSADRFVRATAAFTLPKTVRTEIAAVVAKLNKRAATERVKVTTASVRQAVRGARMWFHPGFRSSVSDVPSGARVKVQNPYTKKWYACSIVVSSGRAKSTKCGAA